jgi:hypothetical protein
MDSTSNFIFYLFGITFGLAIVFGIWQYLKATKARREGHQSADARQHGDRPDAKRRR